MGNGWVGNGQLFKSSPQVCIFYMQQNQRYHLVCSKHSSSFLKPGAYITHNAMWPEWHHCMHFIRLHAASSGATNGIITLFFTYAVVFPRTFKHTLVCRIAVAILLTALIQPHRWNDCRFLFVIQMRWPFLSRLVGSVYIPFFLFLPAHFQLQRAFSEHSSLRVS